MTATQAYSFLLLRGINGGTPVSPRDQDTTEIIGGHSCVDMEHPVILIPERKLNYPFMLAEACWIISGNDRLTELVPYCATMAQYSDDGVRLSGAYGPRFIEQVNYAVNKLTEDPCTRQAVISLWQPNPRPSKDIPCTLNMQWLIREGYIHCNVFMRSSDIWLGWPYDVFSFTMMTQYIRLSLIRHGIIGLKVGNLRIMAGSQHLYARDQAKVVNLIKVTPLVDREFKPMTLYGFNTPDDLLNCLKSLRNVPKDQSLASIEEILCRL